MSASTQTFYWRPYDARIVFILILLDMLSYSCLTFALTLDNSREPHLPAPIPAITNLVTYAEISFAILLCLFAIIMDPAMTYTTTRLIRCSVDDGENNKGKLERKIKVKRPLVGFECYKYCLESPMEYGEVWVDGYRYEEALGRI